MTHCISQRLANRASSRLALPACLALVAIACVASCTSDRTSTRADVERSSEYSPADAGSVAPGLRLSLADARPAHTALNQPTALAQYVAHDDGAFSWELAETRRIEPSQGDALGLTAYFVRLSSQRWLNANQVDHPVWTHWITVVVPDAVRSEVPILFIGGGRRRDTPPENPSAEAVQLARGSGAVTAHLSNVPNQPLIFAGETEARVEDSLIARSWILATQHDDAARIAQFPMVKSAVRAIDALQQFLKGRDLSPATMHGSPLVAGLDAPSVFLMGASKRGWTTWLTASIDPRVKGMAPLVIEILDLNAQIRHHYSGYGFFAPAIRDYVENRVIAKLNDPGIQLVVDHVDPLHALSRVAHVPTYLVSASGDEFFPIDSSGLYADKLSPLARMRYLPNTGHGLRGTTVGADVLSFYAAVCSGVAVPSIDMRPIGSPAPDGSRRFEVNVRPGPHYLGRPPELRVWTATTPAARDFRIGEGASEWTSESTLSGGPLTIIGPDSNAAGLWRAEFEVPSVTSGYRAFFVEASFAPPVSGTSPLVVTSHPVVVPSDMPFRFVEPPGR